MLRLPRFVRLACAVLVAAMLCACGVKGPLVPARKAAEPSAPVAPPPPATNAPQIPEPDTSTPVRPVP